MKSEFRHMLQVMPEAILIYNPASKQLSFANTELKRLLAKYSGALMPENNKCSETERNIIEDAPRPTKTQQRSQDEEAQDDLDSERPEEMLTERFSEIMVVPHKGSESSVSSESHSERCSEEEIPITIY